MPPHEDGTVLCSTLSIAQAQRLIARTFWLLLITLTAAATILGFNVGGTGFDGSVYAVLRLSTGKLLVGGRFYSYNGQDVPDGVARLNADGTVDNTFNSSGTGISGGSTYGPKIRALVEQSDGKLIIGGAFSTYNGTDVPDGLISLSSTGAYDNTFNGVQLGFRIQNSTSFTP